MENEGDESISFQDLGRRGMVFIPITILFLSKKTYFWSYTHLWMQIVTNGGDAKSVLKLDSGLGLFDAFFASFSMIMVSEVCAIYSSYLFFRLTREETQLLLSCFSDLCSAVSS